jgi:large subunit ribosomal protein L10
MLNKQQKNDLVGQLKQDLLGSEFVAVTKNHGLTVSQVTSLRQQVGALDRCSYRVAKNTLLELTVQGSPAECLKDFFVGPTAVAYGMDPVGLAKLLTQFVKDNEKLTVIAGFMSGRILSDKEILALSKLPSLPELLAQIVSFINGAAVELRRLMLAPSMEIHRLLTAIAEGNNN